MNRFCLALILLLATPFAAAAEEDEMMGFIVDDTISHIGHEFYWGTVRERRQDGHGTGVHGEAKRKVQRRNHR